MTLIPYYKQRGWLYKETYKYLLSGADPGQAAFEAFQQAASPQEMQAAASQYPFMTDDGFIQIVKQVIAEQVPPEHKPAFQERLDWLRKIAEEQE
jgi:hypothetical protein